MGSARQSSNEILSLVMLTSKSNMDMSHIQNLMWYTSPVQLAVAETESIVQIEIVKSSKIPWKYGNMQILL